MKLHVEMDMYQCGTSVRTNVWYGSGLYVFSGSIRQAQRRARCYPLVHGAEVSDYRWEGLSLAWLDDIPYLFPRSLTVASGRGKGWP